MKELSIEQKARAYVEAIERAKAFKEHLLEINDKGYADEMDYIFPELAELEDERIRKECISIIDAWDKSCRLQGDYCEIASKCIAWLEKQGKLVDEYEDRLDRCACESFNKDYKSAIEHQKEKQGKEKTMKVYRVENEAEQKGLWRKFDGTWQPLFDMLTDGKCKDMPMEDSPIYRDGGKRWFASAPSKEALQKWFSKTDLEELVSKGFTISEFEVVGYKKVSDFEYIFTRDNIINRNYLEVSDIYSEQKDFAPKFKVGDWIISNKAHEDYHICKITDINNDHYIIESIYGYKGYNQFNIFEESYRLWTIQDAKKGDILQANKCTLIFDSLTKDVDGNTVVSSWYFCDSKRFYGIGTSGPDLWNIEGVVPATKEQRDTLMKAMSDAGYTFDFEKKELEKVEDEIEIPFGAKDSELEEEIYYIPEGFHAEIEGNNVVIKKGEQKSAWSEEDTRLLDNCISLIEDIDCTEDEQNWLKSLKDRIQPKQELSEEDERIYKSITYSFAHNYPLTVQQQEFVKSLRPQPKQEWSEEDEKMLNDILMCGKHHCYLDAGNIAWLKSLKPQKYVGYNPYKATVESIAEMCKHYDKASHSGLRDFYDNVKIKCKDAKEYDNIYPQNTWKPSEEQMEALEHFVRGVGESGYASPYDNNTKLLYSLLEQLKKLREE